MSDDSEEKTLDPSDHKLRKAREKGQVVSSQDFVTACVTSATLIYLLFTWQTLIGTFDRIFSLNVNAFQLASKQKEFFALYATMYEVAQVLAPIAILVTLIGIVANILQKQGIPFSLHPIKPDLSKISISKGFKKIFSRRNATEFAISLVRMTIWFAVAGLICWYFLPGIMSSLLCQGNCLLNEAFNIMLLLVIVVVAMLMFIGLADLPLQKVLFHHEQKMGHKEYKRELKDTMGSPEFRSYHRREHQEAVESAENKQEAGFYLFDGRALIGIFYHSEQEPVPKVVSKHQGQEASDAIKKAKEMGVKVVTESNLTNDIARSVPVGNTIRQRQLQNIAMLMVRENLL